MKEKKSDKQSSVDNFLLGIENAINCGSQCSSTTFFHIYIDTHNADYVIINAFCIIISSKRSIEVHFPIHENVNHSNYINYNNKNI